MSDNHRMAVKNIARQLEKDGYVVQIEPAAAIIPFDLFGYQADILATKGEERLLVEVKTADSRRSLEKYKKISDIVSRHPNWRFLLTTVPPAVEPEEAIAPPDVGRDEIRALVQRLDALLASESYSFAIPYLWNALMAGLRTRAFERKVPVDAVSDLRVISYMYSSGEISHEDYETMRRYYELRSSQTHSVSLAVPKAEVFELRDYVGDKLKEWGVEVEPRSTEPN